MRRLTQQQAHVHQYFDGRTRLFITKDSLSSEDSRIQVYRGVIKTISIATTNQDGTPSKRAIAHYEAVVENVGSIFTTVLLSEQLDSLERGIIWNTNPNTVHDLNSRFFVSAKQIAMWRPQQERIRFYESICLNHKDLVTLHGFDLLYLDQIKKIQNSGLSGAYAPIEKHEIGTLTKAARQNNPGIDSSFWTENNVKPGHNISDTSLTLVDESGFGIFSIFKITDDTYTLEEACDGCYTRDFTKRQLIEQLRSAINWIERQ